MKKEKETKIARLCESCGQKVYDGKHREVALDRKRYVLCSECGRIEFDSVTGHMTCVLQAVMPPLRQGRRGRNVTFHTDKLMPTGDHLKSAVALKIPGKSCYVPSDLVINHVRALYTVDTISPGGVVDGKKQRPRRKRRSLGYTVRAHSA